MMKCPACKSKAMIKINMKDAYVKCTKCNYYFEDRRGKEKTIEYFLKEGGKLPKVKE